MSARQFYFWNLLPSSTSLIIKSYNTFFSPSSIQKDWTVTLKNVSSLITKEQNPNTLLSIRATFYDLLNHCIPASLILKNLSLHILESTDSSLAPELCSIFAEYVQILI